MKNNNKGFTLVELMSAIAISLIIGSVIVNVISVSLDLFRRQQIENQQYIILDGTKQLLNKELRYAHELTIQDGIVDLTQYSTIKIDNNQIIKNETDILLGHSVVLQHTLDLSFHTGANKDNLYVTVIIDQGKEYELEKQFSFRILNIDLTNTEVKQDSASSNKMIVYK